MKAKKSFNLNILLNTPFSTHERFHHQTKIKNLPKKELDSSTWPKAWKTIFFKDYPRLDKIVLPEPSSLQNILFRDILINRSSKRQFSKEPLSLERISDLLYYSAGIRKNYIPSQQGRFYPSPGGRYPLEVYIISLNSELQKGVYHYNLRFHSLETLLLTEDFNPDNYFNQDYINKSSCILIITGCFERTTMKYGNRGYRHILGEAGSLGQNFYLLSAALDIACCGVGGYEDDKLHNLLDVDGIKEAIVYVLVVGNNN